MALADELLASMTLDEKIGQLTMIAAGSAVTGPVLSGDDSVESIRSGRVGNLLNLVGTQDVHALQRVAVTQSRLKIPLLIGFDVIHGHRTALPVPLAEAATFDEALWQRSAREAAIEAAGDGLALTFAPMVDIGRDPRWGRIVEGPGEDPHLAMRMARAKVLGFQTADLSAADAIAACAKHYCAYGAVQAGREYAAVDVSERALHEVHLPPFEAAVAAGVASVMPAFTDLAGIPMTAHRPLLRGWLRQTLGFSGVLISDYNAIAELIHHGVAADLVEAAALALNAGVDIDMMANAYRRGLPAALERGLVDIALVDEAVRRVLDLKERLGLFEDPYRRGWRQPEGEAAKAERRRFAREIARRSAVLLVNEGDTLPLPEAAGHIAVVGPLADASPDMRGPWWGMAEPDSCVTVLEGLRAARPNAEITTAAGVDIESDDVSGIPAVLEACRDAHVVVLCLGEAATMSGEAASRSELGLPGRQRDLAEAVLGLGKPVVVVLFSGRPLTLPWLAERADALLAAFFLGAEAGNAVADILTGAVSPSGRTPVSWPRSCGQIPIFYAERPTGRPNNPKDHYTSKYRDVPNAPLFAFGHGLTYGRFAYRGLKVDPEVVGEADTIEVAVDLANEGRSAAEETVFVFVHDRIASVTRPVMELKATAKLALAPGASGTARATIPVRDLAFPGTDLKPLLEPGEVEILVGPRAVREDCLKATIRLR